MIILKNKKEGFTLIELLVVIAIISLLVSILLPSLKKAKELANTVVCNSNLKGMGMSIYLYAQDWDNYLPPVAYDDSHIWYSYISEYAVGKAPDWDANFWDPSGINAVRTIYTCPSLHDHGVSYVMPEHLSYYWPHAGWYGFRQIGSARPEHPGEDYDYDDTSRVLMLADGFRDHPGKGIHWHWPYSPLTGELMWLAAPHDDRENVLLMDGHSETAHKDVSENDYIINGDGHWGWGDN